MEVGKKVRIAAYKGFIRPTHEYTSTRWDPWNTKCVQYLEKVQERSTATTSIATPVVFPKMIQDLHWKPLQTRRLKIRRI
jgi:hypothetical protein